MTTPLDLEAMAEKLIAVITDNELNGISYPSKQAILSALREVETAMENQTAECIRRSFDSENARLISQLEQKDKEIERINNFREELRSKFRNREEVVIAQQIRLTRLTELVELAWGVIANAGGGNWDIESTEWKKAAERWRDDYHQLLNETKKEV